MFKIALQIKKADNDTLVLRLPPVLRAAFLFFTCFIIFSMIWFPMEEGARGTDYLPVLFAVIALFVTLYEEKWVFDTKRNTVEKRFGLIFYYSRETADLSDAGYFRISEVRKGNRNKSSSRYYKLSLVFRNETEKDIELVYFREKDKLVKNAETISSFCSVPLKTE